MKQKSIIIIYTIIIFIQIFLVSVQPINGKHFMIYDDLLQAEIAQNITQGKWLGEYNNLTLVKGVFAPIFMAVSNILKIPFLIAQDIFYIGACLSIIIVLRKKIKSKIVMLISFSILIFHPIIYSVEMCRVYRDGIYLSLILYLFAFTIGLFLNRREKIKKLIKYYIAIGLTISAIYLTREEFIWIVPYLILAFTTTIIYFLKDKMVDNKIKKCLFMLIPIIIILIITNIVKGINYKYYGVYELNQYWSKEFKEAYGALTRILPEEKLKMVPVTHDVLLKAYEISPKFAELKDFLEDEHEDNDWKKPGDAPRGEYEGADFHWALMEAVKVNGYYKDPKTVNQFYEQIAEEINKACDENKVECLPNKRVSNVILFDIKDIKESIISMKETMEYQYRLIDVNSKQWQTYISSRETEIAEQRREILRGITNSEIFGRNSYQKTEDKIRLQILNILETIYQKLNPIIFIESIIVSGAFFAIVIIRKQKKDEEILILLGILGIYLLRIFIISFTYVTMFTSARNILYLAPTYIFQILFFLLANIFFIRAIKDK